MKDIKLGKETHKELTHIKIDLEKKTFDETICFLINSYKNGKPK